GVARLELRDGAHPARRRRRRARALRAGADRAGGAALGYVARGLRMGRDARESEPQSASKSGSAAAKVGASAGRVRNPKPPRNADRFRARYGPAALVTGAAQGIGRAFADALARRGLAVYLLDVQAEPVAAAAREVGEAFGVQ